MARRRALKGFCSKILHQPSLSVCLLVLSIHLHSLHEIHGAALSPRLHDIISTKTYRKGTTSGPLRSCWNLYQQETHPALKMDSI